MKRTEQDNKLQSGLQAYADSVEASGALTGFRQRLGNWPVYAAAAGSALAFSTSATANTIVYNGSPSYGIGISANIDGNEFTVRATGTPVNPSTLTEFKRNVAGVVINGRSISMGAPSYPKAFLKGHSVTSKGNFQPANFAVLARAEIEPEPSFWGAWGFGPPYLPRYGEVMRYAAIRLGNGDLGWMNIAVRRNPLNFPDSAAILSWAYNDVPGAPILTGETANTPEPSSLALLALLATGAAGVLAFRRRRKAAASQVAGSPQ
jgi:hypothetical protein